MLLAFNNDALQLFKNRKLLVRRVNLGIALLFARQESDFLKALELALNVARIFLYQLGEAAHVGVKIWIFRIHHNDFSAHSTSNKNV